ncbi:hypothetical protein [Kosakonia sp.]|uniref:hypothetical protein n=1 Tax=Kosakonia sp. TaxID=1916651 RepID=UPI0028B04291|nr:hypothetical protein [Kosakonia sp.]
MRKIFLVVAITLLFGCKPGADKAIDLAKNEVAASMKDPDSAKFRYVRFIQSGESDDGTVKGFVCGHVNAKNGYGAYAGFSPFIVDISMKEKGLFSKGVEYSIFSKKLFSESTPLDVKYYNETCGQDE